MSYQDSHIYQVRQKVGDIRLITATVNVLPINQDGKIKLVRANQFGYWTGVGGHVELGDSWQSAALHELEEEAGIIAEPNDLELYATISGPGRIYEYPDGTTQPFTLAFLCRHWQSESVPTDAEEISQTAWLTLDEARARSADRRFLMLLDAYEVYLKSGQVQMVVEP